MSYAPPANSTKVVEGGSVNDGDTAFDAYVDFVGGFVDGHDVWLRADRNGGLDELRCPINNCDGSTDQAGVNIVCDGVDVNVHGMSPEYKVPLALTRLMTETPSKEAT